LRLGIGLSVSSQNKYCCKYFLEFFFPEDQKGLEEIAKIVAESTTEWPALQAANWHFEKGWFFFVVGNYFRGGTAEMNTGVLLYSSSDSSLRRGFY